MDQVRIIKRYANRKLYDTQHSRYVTLDQISEMIRNGDDVKIIDNKSKEDLTSVTLAQIIFEEEKKQRSFLPLQTMRNIIQNGGESFAQLVTEAQRRVTEAQRRMTNILPRRKDGEESELGEAVGEAVGGTGGDAAADSVEAIAARKMREGLGSLREFREWVQQTQNTIDEWQRRMDDRIRHVVEGITPFAGLQKDVKVLAERIAALEAKLEGLAEEDQEGIADSNGGHDASEAEHATAVEVDIDLAGASEPAGMDGAAAPEPAAPGPESAGPESAAEPASVSLLDREPS